MSPPPSGVFISYRRADTGPYARLLAVLLDPNPVGTVRQMIELDALPGLLDFSEFFAEFAPRLHRWLARRCGSDKTMAEDLAQEALKRAWERWEKVGRYESPHAWVFRVAGQMLWRYRRGLANSALEMPELHDHRIGDIESFVDFDRALRYLSPDQRRVAVLVFLLEYTPVEAAEVLGLNGSTVRSHVLRVRLQLACKHLLDPPSRGLPGAEEGR